MKSKAPLASVVVVTYNNKEWLEVLIRSVLAQSAVVELIVVDNASLDGAASWVEENFSQVKVVREKENRGFGAGCNAGARQAKGKYLIFGNEDMYFKKDYVEKLVEVMEEDKTIGAIMGTTYEFMNDELGIRNKGKELRMLSEWESSQEIEFWSKLKVQSQGLLFNYTGMLAGSRRASGGSRAKRPRMQNCEETGDQWFESDEEVKEIFAVTAPFCIRKSTYEQVGGFDEDFFLYFEEVDLCWRVWLSGKRVVLAVDARSMHKGGVSTSKLPPQEILEYTVRNRLQSYLINLGWPRIFISFILQLLIGTASVVFLSLQLKLALSLAVVRAWFWNFWHLRRTLVKRFEVQDGRKLSDGELVERVGGSIPVSKLFFLIGFRKSINN